MPSLDRPTGEMSPGTARPPDPVAPETDADRPDAPTRHDGRAGVRVAELGCTRDPAIAAIVDRAAALSPEEIARLALNLRLGSREPRAIRIAVSRSGRSTEARALSADIAAAVQRAARAAGAERALASLGLVFDAGMAAADAALAVLVADRLSAEVAARLSAPWTELVEESPCRS